VGLDSKATRLEAEKAAAIIAGKLAADDLSPLTERPAVGPKSDPTVKAVATEWVAWHQEHFPRRASTQENYQSFIDSRLIPMLGERRVSSITRAAVQEFVAALRKDGIAYTTLRSQYLPVFRKILDYCVERGMLVANPFRSGGPLFEPSDADREAAPKPDPFTPKEIDAILGASTMVQPEFGLMLRTWSETGARSGEIRGLQVKDLDVKARTLRIERTLLERDGKAVTGPTKNLRGRRTVELPAPLVKLLAAHVAGKAPEAFVFTRPSDGGPVTNGSLKERWTRTLDLAGVRYREPEQMRHSYISNAMSRGENALRIANTTGHTVAVLLAHYAAWIPQDVPAASDRKPAASGRRKAA
jgi:integrase